MLSRRSAIIGMLALVASKPAFAQTTRSVRAPKKGWEPYKIDPIYEPQVVAFSGYKPGTIVIDPKKKFLYLVLGWGKARRYGVAVGREGLDFHGTAIVGRMTEWPRWIPTADMVKKEPGKYARYKVGMDGGPSNPLGARAIYLFQGNRDTYVRIHGTNEPSSIGHAVSHGCFRMINEHVIELFEHVKIGTTVVVL